MTMTQGKHFVVPVSERDHSQGPATAAVTLVQYGDYECPYTRQSTTIVRAIQQQLGDTLRFVFRNFPLTAIHPHALHAALAAEAAATQGGHTQHKAGGNERSAGQPSPMRPGGTPARPCICGHRSWAKSEWN